MEIIIDQVGLTAIEYLVRWKDGLFQNQLPEPELRIGNLQSGGPTDIKQTTADYLQKDTEH